MTARNHFADVSIDRHVDDGSGETECKGLDWTAWKRFRDVLSIIKTEIPYNRKYRHQLHRLIINIWTKSMSKSEDIIYF
jgi:hypothetical protein